MRLLGFLGILKGAWGFFGILLVWGNSLGLPRILEILRILWLILGTLRILWASLGFSNVLGDSLDVRDFFEVIRDS